MNEGPEQEAQSGWHVKQAPELEDEGKVDVGQVETHVPDGEARRLEEQVRQKLALPTQVAHDEEQAE